jgi:hypothetical protein
VANERLIRKLGQVEAVRRDLAALLERLRVAIRLGIANLRRGVPVSEQTPEAAKIHVELVQKLDEMHHAVHEARAEGVRVLVEDEGMPVSTVAGLMGRPRQLVSRLYQQARSARGAPVNGKRSANGNGGRPGDGRAPNGRPSGANYGGRGSPPAPPRPSLGRPATGAERSGGQRTRMPPAAQ